jgi:hypothetical protein
VLVVCEYATNDLKGTIVEQYEQHHIQGHDAFDPGAADLSHFISEYTKCMAFHSNFSKLLIDNGKPLLHDRIVPFDYLSDSERDYVSFNKDGFDLPSRISNYYYMYHKVLSEVLWFLDPAMVVLIRSHLANANQPDLHVSRGHSQVQTLLPIQEKRFDDFSNTSLKHFWGQNEKSIETIVLSVDSNFLQFDQQERQTQMASQIGEYLLKELAALKV